MDLKKKVKGFFTLNRKANGGFTLVELIVVIAILAILAGAAVPAYSGYVKKANKVADEQLLAALNTAFAAACMANGENNYGRRDVSVQMTAVDGGRDAAVAVSGIADFNESFNGFYEGGTFKVMTELFYNKTLGMFAENAAVTFTFGDTTITLSAEDIAILSGENAFSDRGSAALLADIGVLENLLKTGIGDDALDDVKHTDAFLWALGSYAGMTKGESETDDAYLDRVAAYMEDTNNANAVYSAQIMFAASQAANATEENLSFLFTGDAPVTSKITVRDADGNADANATMANAALAYGMYTAYMQQYPAGDEEQNTDFAKVINSAAFKTYYASSQGQSDLEAYMAAMSMISDNTSNSEVTSSILNNGITKNQELAELMKEVMGN